VCIALGVLGMSVATPGMLQGSVAAPVGFGLSPSMTGYLSSLGALAGAFAAFFSSRVTTRFGAERTVQLCTATLFISIAGMGLFMHWLPGFITMMTLMSAGIGLAFAGISNYLVACISTTQTGQVTGFASMIRTSFNAVSAGLIGTVLALGAIAGTKFTESWAYVAVFIACSVLLLIGFFLSLLLPRRTVHEGSDTESTTEMDDSTSGSAVPSARTS
jgi:MFS family permease